jgi:hypothetical protein
MDETLFTEELDLLTMALQRDSFHFVIIGYNHPDIYTHVRNWLRLHLPERPIQELTVSGKNYREIIGELDHAGQNIVMIADFDWLLSPENEPVAVALNQRRDYFARRELNLLCFIPSNKFRLLPVKIPDLWSLRSLELDFACEQNEVTPPCDDTTNEISSLGGSTIPEKEDEIERIVYQIQKAEKDNRTLLHLLNNQLVTLQNDISIILTSAKQ